MVFVLIQFTEEDGNMLALVHETWLTPRKSEVYWPPYKSQTAYKKALFKGEPVDCKKWELFHIKKIFGSYENFEIAQRKAKAAEETSDLQTDTEPDNVILPRKRQICRPIRFAENDHDNSSDELDEYDHSNLQRPPKFSKVNNFEAENTCKSVRQENERLRTTSSTVSFCSTVSNIDNFEGLGTSSSSISSRSICDIVSNVDNFEQLGTPLSEISSRITVSNVDNIDTLETPTNVFSRVDTPNTKDAGSSKLIHYLSTVIEQNKEILAILKSKTPNLYHSATLSPANLPVKLPLDSIENIDVFESFLVEQQNAKLMSVFLSTLDRTGLASCTSAILKHCISYKLARGFSFLGTRQNKIAFSKYNNLKKVIIGAVKRAFPSAVERNIEDNIKNWLKRAPKNYNLEQEKLRKQEAIENGLQEHSD